MTTNLPVIFLAFANEQHGGRYLTNVVNEYKALDAILRPIDANRLPENSEQALCKVVVRNNASINDIIEVFNDFKDQVAIFHYAGHADGYQLLLEGKDGESQLAKGPGLVSILSSKKNLKLVFLNGCSTQRLARDLADQGIPVVIGTADSIQDDLALDIAKRFYGGLAAGHTLAGAWEEAKNEARAIKDVDVPTAATNDAHRGIKLPSKNSGRFPWEEEFSRSSAAHELFEHWNLPEEAKNPLRFLPKPREAALPAEPFLFLKPYESRHAEIFFGRSRYIQELYLKILEPISPPIILLYGETGAGKSSLLDAGLRPRLAVAPAEDHPDELMFEVRYERRDADVGLVGTLARMLEYTPEKVVIEEDIPEPETNGLTTAELNKLEQLEKLAEELKEEKAKYSLISIIDSYRHRQLEKPGETFIGGLYQNGRLLEDAGTKLRAAWKKVEQDTGRRLIIILDQVEELFTQAEADIHQPADMDTEDESDSSVAKQNRELEDLLEVLKAIFRAVPVDETDEIRGKIILGYREEFNAKIEARIKEQELSRTSVFLEQLNEEDINDIFRGLQRGRAKEEYNITVDDKLMPLVSNHLLTGKSAVGPVLQLLLTKLWTYAHRQNPGAPFFSVRAFHEVQSQGKEMEEYFETQMKKINAWNPEVVDSGLVLDMLHHHVSERGTSNRRHIDTIKKRYQHLPKEFEYPEDFIVRLVNKLKSPDIFLLNDLGRGFTTLPHDTLAPVIIREYNQSDKFGQRADRILKTKEPDLIRAETAGDDEMRKLRLDDNDLEVIQEGQRGMRILNERERQLLAISRHEREKRLRLRRLMIKGGIVAGLFILVLSILAGSLSVNMTDQIQQGVINRANEASVVEQEKNLDKAIQLAQFAYNEGQVRQIDVVKNLYSLYDDYQQFEAFDFYEEDYYEEDYYSEEDFEEDVPPLFDDGEVVEEPATVLPGNERPHSMAFKTSKKIVSQHYYPDIGVIAGLDNGELDYWSNSDLRTRRTFLFDQIGDDDYHNIQYCYSADGSSFQALYRGNKFPSYLLAGKLAFPYWSEIYIGSESYDYDVDPAEDTGVQTERELVGYYNFFTSTLSDADGYNYNLKDFKDYLADAYYLTDYQLYTKNLEGRFVKVSVDKLFAFDLVDEERSIFRTDKYEQLRQSGWAVMNMPNELDLAENTRIRPTKLAASYVNASWIWHPNEDAIPEMPTLVDTTLLYYLTALSDNSFLVVDAYQNLVIRDQFNQPIASLLPPDSRIVDLELSPDHHHIVGLTDQNQIYIWDLAGTLLHNFDHADIFDLKFSNDGKQLLTVSEQAVYVWSFTSRVGNFFDKPADMEQPISFARFHPDHKRIVLGLSAKEKTSLGRQIRNIVSDKYKSKIILWDPEDLVSETFIGPAGLLKDATVSHDGRFAVAVQSGRALIIPNPTEKIAKNTYNTEPIKAAVSTFGGDKIFLSPGGKYLLRQSIANNTLELFDHQGNRITGYSFQNGFQQGFNGQLFTPDDHYLISHRSKELFYWHPLDEKVTSWSSDFALSLEDKQQYRLDTFMDYIPGSSIDAKWWAIAVMLVAFIFTLLYFSDFILSFVLKKEYTALLLYSMGFFLLLLFLTTFWLVGVEEVTFKRVLLYVIALGTILMTGFGAVSALKKQKWNVLLPMVLVLAFTVFGMVKFFGYETNTLDYMAEKSQLSGILQVYKYEPTRFHELYRGRKQLTGTAGSTQQRLSSAELLTIFRSHPEAFYDIQEERTSEWPQVVIGLISLLAFIGLIVFPIYRSLRRYQRQATFDRTCYGWLFVPVVSLGMIFWIGSALGLTTEDEYPFVAILKLLNIVSAILLGAMVLPLAIRAYRERQYACMAMYGVPLLLAGSLLFDQAGLFVLNTAVGLVLGWLHRKDSSFGRSFAYFSIAIFTFIAVLLLMMFTSGTWVSDAILEGFVITILLGAITYGIWDQGRRMRARKISGKQRWGNGLIVFGLWLAGLVVAGYYNESMYGATDESLAEFTYYEDEFWEDEFSETDLLNNELTEDGTITEREDQYEGASPLDDAAAPEEELAEEISAAEPAESELAVPPLQQLIIQLFGENADAQDNALDRLRTNYRDHIDLIPTLLDGYALHADQPSALFNVIFLLENQSSAVLQAQSELVRPFLDSVENPEVTDRVEKLLDRMEGLGG